jgi:hypothetical protein
MLQCILVSVEQDRVRLGVAALPRSWLGWFSKTVELSGVNQKRTWKKKTFQ